MLVTRIDTHVPDALSRLLEQYKGRPRIAGIFTSLVTQVQILEDMLFSLDSGRQLWNGTSTPAVGQQLDNIGTLVGISRNGLSDTEYILFLFGKIAENFSDSTIPTLLTVIGYVFQAQTVLLYEYYPASLVVEAIGTPVPKDLWQTAANIVSGTIGGGIKLIFSGASSTTKVFRFAGAGVTGSNNGFGSPTDPTVGGGFIDLIS